MFKTVVLVCVVVAAVAAFAYENELRWDNGRFGLQLNYAQGVGTWFANDFDTSGLVDAGYDWPLDFVVTELRIYCDRSQPNGVWDGFRVAIFDYTDGVPGAILWPENGEPKLVIPEEGTIAGWYEFPVVWPPRGKWQFLVGQEQYYDWPNCDPFCFDDNQFITTEKHTWFGYEGRWSNFEATNNLMLRIMAGYIGAVSPTSLGRIKGLYR